MDSESLNDKRALSCPWCGSNCMYLEQDSHISLEGETAFRIDAYCDNWLKASDVAYKSGDPSGNDFGRTNWCDSIDEAISDWNYCVVEGEKVNHKNFW